MRAKHDRYGTQAHGQHKLGYRHTALDVRSRLLHSRRDVYLCGPEGLITAATKVLDRLRVPKRPIHLDPIRVLSFG